MKNTVWYGVTSQLCDTVLLVAAFVQWLLNIHPPLHVPFNIDSVIVVAISHTLSAIYLNRNESSGFTSG